MMSSIGIFSLVRKVNNSTHLFVAEGVYEEAEYDMRRCRRGAGSSMEIEWQFLVNQYNRPELPKRGRSPRNWYLPTSRSSACHGVSLASAGALAG
jgi:hypothetical protein